jgi:hypothetical protein
MEAQFHLWRIVTTTRRESSGISRLRITCFQTSESEAAKKDPSRGARVKRCVRRLLSSGNHDERDAIYDKSVLHCEDEKIGILIFGAGCCGLHTAGERHALQKIDHVTIMQHNSVPLCPALHDKKRGCQSRRPRQLCQFRTFSCARTVYKSYTGTALPQKSRSRPPPPTPP